VLAGGSPARSHGRMLAHITPLEAPIVWLAFAAGIALGAFATWFVMNKRAATRT
jgi:hypothetical protein